MFTYGGGDGMVPYCEFWARFFMSIPSVAKAAAELVGVDVQAN
jgi:hypothetical protein